MKKARRKINLEQYFTDLDVAKKLTNETIEFLGINPEEIEIVEPSAGDGSFSKYISEITDKGFYYDIEPMDESIKKQDFLKLNKKFEDSLFIGNPPFGYKGSLAIEFVNHSFELGAKYVAFILPYTFIRYSLQNKINKKASLVYSKELENNLYKNLDSNKDMEIKTVFQIWELDSKKEDLRVPRPRRNHPDFEIHMYNLDKERISRKWFDAPWDFCIYRQGFYDYEKRFYPKDFKSLNLEKYQYMIFKAKSSIALKNLLNMDFDEISKGNLVRPGVSVGDIVEKYYELYDLVEDDIETIEIKSEEKILKKDIIEKLKDEPIEIISVFNIPIDDGFLLKLDFKSNETDVEKILKNVLKKED